MNLRRTGLVVAAALIAGCSSSASTSVVGPTGAASKCGVTASGSASTFGSSGGSGTIKISTERECSWNANATAAWIVIQGPTTGQGEGTLQFVVAPNPAPSSRKAAVVVQSNQIDISQDGAPCRFSLDRPSADIASAGGQIVVGVSAMTGCAWNVASRADWIAVTGTRSGNGNGQVRLTVAPNSSAARSGTVAIADQVVTVTQAAAGAPPPAPAPDPGPQPPAPAPPTPAPPAPTDQTVDLQGTISNLRGFCPNIFFLTSNRTIVADASTDFRKASCGSLKNGVTVEVRGPVWTDGTVHASRIEVRDGNEGSGGQ